MNWFGFFIQENFVLVLKSSRNFSEHDMKTLKLIGDLTDSRAVNNCYLYMLAEGIPNNVF